MKRIINNGTQRSLHQNVHSCSVMRIQNIERHQKMILRRQRQCPKGGAVSHSIKRLVGNTSCLLHKAFADSATCSSRLFFSSFKRASKNHYCDCSKLRFTAHVHPHNSHVVILHHAGDPTSNKHQNSSVILTQC